MKLRVVTQCVIRTIAECRAVSRGESRAREPASEPVVEPEPEFEPEPEPELQLQPPPAREAVVLYGGLDRATLAFFERVFNGSKDPTILQHCIFASALACATDADGSDELGLRAHLAAQSQILHRVSLHEKLGKREPISEYAGSLIARQASTREHGA